MSRLSAAFLMLLVSLVFFAQAFLSQTPIAAQEAAPETVKIVTVDGVRLTGSFYPSGKKNSPTAIILHPIGEGKSMKIPELRALAETLQKKNIAVLMFDFRGHGDSTALDSTETFLSQNANKFFGKKKGLEEIDVKDYIKNTAYMPVLVNDIAAAKAFLDRKNDEGACNTANTIVIGADNGATLGAIWMNAEWNRFKANPPMPPMTIKWIPEKKAEGSNIVAAVFFTIQSSLATGRNVPVATVLTNAVKTHSTAALFFYGKDDAKAKNFNKDLENKLKNKNTKKQYMSAVELDTNLSGTNLLKKGLKVDKLPVNDAVAKWLGDVVEEKTNEWGKREFLDTYFMWRIPNTVNYMPAKNRKGEKNLNFDTYDRFAQ